MSRFSSEDYRKLKRAIKKVMPDESLLLAKIEQELLLVKVRREGRKIRELINSGASPNDPALMAVRQKLTSRMKR